jgi:hypothetical protein
MRTLLGLVLMSVLALPALGNEAQIRRALAAELGSNAVEAVSPGPMP